MEKATSSSYNRFEHVSGLKDTLEWITVIGIIWFGTRSCVSEGRKASNLRDIF